jgi:hypothetical protein
VTYVDPAIWAIVGVSTAAEIVAALILVRRMGYPTKGLARALVFINVTTWAGFAVALDTLLGREWRFVPAVASAEVLVVAAETVLIRAATERRWAGRPPLPYGPAFVVSLAGNAVSIAVSVGLLFSVAPHLFE